MALIFIASALPGSELPDYGIWDTLVKKGGHMLGYALLATAFHHGLGNGKNSARFRYAASFAMIVLYAISDEWHQKFTPGRNASPGDVCIDAVGGFIGLTVWPLIQRHLKVAQNQRKPPIDKDFHDAA
jgi:VanZ family protein